jgi:hypothetical protein
VEGFGPLTITAGEDGTAALPDYTGQAVTSDNVGVTIVTQEPAAQSARLFGKTTVTLRAHDAAGNTREKSFEIYVVLDGPLVKAVGATVGVVPGAGVDGRIPEGARFTSVGFQRWTMSEEWRIWEKWKSAGVREWESLRGIRLHWWLRPERKRLG